MDSNKIVSQIETEKIKKAYSLSEKSKKIAAVLGFLCGPAGYAYIGEWGLAALSLLTANYLFFGVIIIPFHVMGKIDAARNQIAQLKAQENSKQNGKGAH